MLKTKITALVLALFVVVSTIGISHVSHFCNMAISNFGKKTCEQSHNCCKSSNDSCCIPVYKYYHSEIASVVSKPMAPVTPAFSDLFFIYASPALIVTSQSVLFEHLTDHVVIPTGPDIRISSGSLLI